MKDREKSLATMYAIIALEGCTKVHDIPDRAKWVARDSGGTWFAYTSKPHRLAGGQWYITDPQHEVNFYQITKDKFVNNAEGSKLYKI